MKALVTGLLFCGLVNALIPKNFNAIRMLMQFLVPLATDYASDIRDNGLAVYFTYNVDLALFHKLVK